MNVLSELIDDLLCQCESHDSSPASSPAADTSLAQTAQPDTLVMRVRQVLEQMGELLSQEDLPVLDQDSPTDEIRLRILNHWQELTSSIHGIRQHMESLEQDIARMQPWGDFDVLKLDKLAAHGIVVRFWRIGLHNLPATPDAQFLVQQQAHVISQDAEWMYYVTIQQTGSQPVAFSRAEAIEVCPCPISTLIMLQTRDKDKLQRLETLRADYALAHYAEVYAALRQLLPPGSPMPQLQSGHKSLRQKLRLLFANR